MRSPLLVGVSAVFAFGLASAEARVDGYPYIDNETLGLFEVVRKSVEGPPEQFADRYWAPDLLDALTGGTDAMSPLRYMIAFTGYAVALTANHTPAWRAPYRDVLGALIEKMFEPVAWQDWLVSWGDDPFGPDNVMYTGHLVYMLTLYRQQFGDRRYDEPFAITASDGRRFETDHMALAASLAAQADAYVDVDGQHVYNLACEPGRIFLPCNTPHRVHQIAYDSMFETAYSGSNARWLEWSRAFFVHEETGVLYHLYFPFGAWQAESGEVPPAMHESLSGLYNGWSIWFLQALDPVWAEALYARYRGAFVVAGTSSPYEDGRTMVRDNVDAEGLLQRGLDAGATGFGLIVSRLFGDSGLFGELSSSWTRIFGEPTWTVDGREFSHRVAAIPLTFQNGFPLLARTTRPDHHLGTLARAVRSESFFAAPHLAAVSNRATFVNQALYDEARRRLIITVNGGAATDAPTDLEIAGLDSNEAWAVWRDDELHDGWRLDGSKLVITTLPLGPDEVSYVVAPAPAIIADAGLPDAGPLDAAPDSASPETSGGSSGGCAVVSVASVASVAMARGEGASIFAVWALLAALVWPAVRRKRLLSDRS